MNKKVVAFSGKGGVGKTTSLILFLKYLIKEHPKLKTLVIDADPDANIADLINKNVQFRDTLAGKMRDYRIQVEQDVKSIYDGKKSAIESEIFNALMKLDNFHLLEMGRMEGEGCYCFINNVLKHGIDIIAENYDVTLIDSPAGLEHFSRKTGRRVTDLIIVVDPTQMAMKTMNRIIELTGELELEFEKIWVLGNRFPNQKIEELLLGELEQYENNEGIKYLGYLKNNSEINRHNLLGKNLLNLSEENEVYQQAKKIYKKILE
ncbi:MAG: AAA family ATPase [Promethearchaeia archaeon]